MEVLASLILQVALLKSSPVLPPQKPIAPVAIQGIYMTSNTVASENGAALVDELKKLGGNSVVFDVQDSTGRIAFPSQLPLSLALNNTGKRIGNLAEVTKKLHDKGIYVIARFVLFKNPFLAEKKPEWALRSKSGGVFDGRDGPVWIDPSNPEVRQYYADLSREIAYAGVDEIQFDYIRFPEGGKGGRIDYSFISDNEQTQDEAITASVRHLASAIHLLGTKVSVDTFGIVVWDNVSWKIIGQNIPELAKYVDAMYPMPYPSHFGPGWGGHVNPADEPYFFVQETTKKFVTQVEGTQTEMRPWLQAFTLRVTNYNADYIREQIRALKDIGIESYVIWNARNDYEIPFIALQK